MNTKYVALALLAVTGTAVSAAPKPSHPKTAAAKVAVASKASSARIVGTWDGTNAYATGDCKPVYALSLTNASYTRQSGAIETDSCGFQCVELAVRYFNYRKHIPASSWHAAVATDMCNRKVPGVTKTSRPVTGDLVVLRADDKNPAIQTGDAGHVAIVTGVSGDTISTFNQNWANSTTARAKISQRRDALCFLHAGR